MRIFVTGATGFIGGHLTRFLAGGGHEVLALSRDGRPVDGCIAVRGDLREVRSFADHLTRCDAVVHAGALLDLDHDPELTGRVNHLATVELARTAVERGVGTFVFISSIAAVGYPKVSGLVGEEVSCQPVTAYGRAKREAERELLEIAHSSATRIVVIRPPTVYGTGETRNFLYLTRAINSGLFVVPGPGENRISFCHAANLVAAIELILEREAICGLLHVTDGPSTTLRQVVEVIGMALGKRTLPVPFPMPVARSAAMACELAARLLGVHPPLSRQRLETLTRDFALDAALVRRHGFSPMVSFEEGVRDTVRWYRKEGLLRREYLLGRRA